MNEILDEILRDIADRLRQRFGSYPSEAPEWKILTQDLSRNPSASRPLLPDNTRIGINPREKRVYDALRRSHVTYQRIFVIYYVTRWGRKRKMAALGCNKSELYASRDKLHSYLEGILHGGR